MKQLVENLNQLFADFTKDAASQVESGNKAAGTRARKASLAIEKVLKEFRKASIAATKQNIDKKEEGISVYSEYSL